MPTRTNAQNLQLAKQIAAKLGRLIDDASSSLLLASRIPPAFMAGLISVENSMLNPRAERFEPGVFSALTNLRDRGWRLSRLAGIDSLRVVPRRNYNGITQKQLIGLSDSALRNLATSFGYTQIMGYWVLKDELRTSVLGGAGKMMTVGELASSRHAYYAVILLNKVAGLYLRRKDYPSALRIWNTGSPTGRTHDPAYVVNAMGVMAAYHSLK